MQTRAFEHFLKHLSELTERQRKRLLDLLLSARRFERVTELIDHTDDGAHRCPRCGSMKSYRHGQANGLQRYRCRSCGRTFNALSGTPLARLRLKAHWLDYLDRMLDSVSVRRCATELGVASTTTFRWRHRFLARTRDDRPAQLGGIAEADEMYVLESHKGSRTLDRAPRKRGGKATKRGVSNEQVCVLVARDRDGRTIDAVVGKGALTPQRLHTHLQARLAPDVLLVTDGHAAYPAFARAAGISHEAVNASAGVRTRGALHIQNVNAYHSRMRCWLVGFRGVASRYLANYFGWRWALDGRRIADREAFLKAALGRFNT
jgi:transposase-like protein